MHIPQIITNIPTFFHNTWKKRDFYLKNNWIVEHWKKTKENWTKSSVWHQQVKPFYQCNIKPLNKNDKLLLTGSVLTAMAVLALSYHFFIVFFPIVMGLSGLFLFGVYSISRSRIQNDFNEKAWKHVDKIREIVHEISYTNQKFNEINSCRILLDKPKFKHLENELKKLDEELHKFSRVALASYFENNQGVVLEQINTLKGQIQTNANDKTIVDELEKEIIQIGTPTENLRNVESKKLELNQLQTISAKLIALELKQSIKKLTDSATEPRFLDSKKSFIAYLESFQKKLSKTKTIEPLAPLENNPPAQSQKK